MGRIRCKTCPSPLSTTSRFSSAEFLDAVFFLSKILFDLENDLFQRDIRYSCVILRALHLLKAERKPAFD